MYNFSLYSERHCRTTQNADKCVVVQPVYIQSAGHSIKSTVQSNHNNNCSSSIIATCRWAISCHTCPLSTVNRACRPMSIAHCGSGHPVQTIVLKCCSTFIRQIYLNKLAELADVSVWDPRRCEFNTSIG